MVHPSVAAIGVGVVSGMRTLLMPALISRAPTTEPGRFLTPGTAPRRLQSLALSRALTVAAVTELIGDKLAATPDRTQGPSLVARAASGAVAATVFAGWNGDARIPAAMLGLSGAIGSAHVMMRLRKASARLLDIPDPLVGLAEDCLAFVMGRSLIESATRKRAAHGAVVAPIPRATSADAGTHELR